MNRKQKIVLWLGIVIVVLMGLFPPWTFSGGTRNYGVKINAGYKWLSTPPSLKLAEGAEKDLSASLDFSRLAVQWAMVTVVTGGLLITFKNNKKD